MKLSEFILLNEEGKKRTVMNNAVALAQITYPDIIIFLFQLDSYYIEAYCNKASLTIEEYKVLPDVNAIGHYLEAIPIDDLLNWSLPGTGLPWFKHRAGQFNINYWMLKISATFTL